MTIEDIIGKFNTTPFLFIGSGISRRYLNLPDWKGLLKHFAECISDDEFIYDSYENKAKTMNCKSGLMPKVAELIQRDFDEKWFADGNIRTIDREQAEKILLNAPDADLRRQGFSIRLGQRLKGVRTGLGNLADGKYLCRVLLNRLQ